MARAATIGNENFNGGGSQRRTPLPSPSSSLPWVYHGGYIYRQIFFISRWKIKIFLSFLEQIRFWVVYVNFKKWLFNSAFSETYYLSGFTGVLRSSKFRGCYRYSRSRSLIQECYLSSSGCVRSQTGLHFSFTTSSEEKWILSSLSGFTTGQCCSGLSEVQNGIPQGTQAAGSEGRLYDIYRLTRWLLTCSCFFILTTLVAVQVEGRVLSFFCSTVWVIISAFGLYQNDSTYYSFPSGAGHSCYGLSGRYNYICQNGGGEQKGYIICPGAPMLLWMVSKLRKVVIRTVDFYRISGFFTGLSRDETFCPGGKEKSISECLFKTFTSSGKRTSCKIKDLIVNSWKTSEFGTCGAFLLVAPSGFGAVNSRGSKRGKQVRFVGYHGISLGSGDGGGSMVDRMAERMERKFSVISSNKSRPLLGRERYRLRGSGEQTAPTTGSSSSSRVLDGIGTARVGQFARDDGSREGGEGVYQMASDSKYGGTSLHRFNSDLHVPKQDGRKISPPSEDCQTGVRGVRSEPGSPRSGAYSRKTQRGGGQTLTMPHGSHRLVSQSRSVPLSRSTMGSTYRGFFCDQKQLPVTSLCELGSRREGNLYRWTPKPLSKGERVREPPVLNYWEDFRKTLEHQQTTDTGRSRMAKSTVVASVNGDAKRHSRFTSRYSRPLRSSSESWHELSTVKSTLEGSRLSSLRTFLNKSGLSSKATEVILSRWTSSTNKNYDAIWCRWEAFCLNKNCNKLNPKESAVTEFLSEEFEKYNTSSAVKHGVSALGSVLELTSGLRIADLPLVKSFRNAASKLVPTGPAYETIWDITVVLRYIRDWGPASSLDLKTLRLKAIILLRIDLLGRSSDVAKIFRSEIHFGKGYMECRIFRPKEWSDKGLKSYGEFSPKLRITQYADARLCTVSTLEEWMRRSRVLVEGEEKARVFCSLTKKRGRIQMLKSSTIAKLCYPVMVKAGVPPQFKPQSLRGAAASAALDYGASLEDILQQGRWSTEGMFRKYYYRRIERPKLPPKSLSLVNALRRGLQ